MQRNSIRTFGTIALAAALAASASSGTTATPSPEGSAGVDSARHQAVGGIGGGYSVAPAATAHAGPVAGLLRGGEPILTGDSNGNGRVDLGDATDFFPCLGGPDLLVSAGDPCAPFFDFDDNTVIDLRDAAGFQLAFESID